MRFTSRMLLRSVLVRRSRSFTALAAVTIAATVATALLNLYFDTQSKLTREFRRFGANAVLSGAAIDTSHLPLRSGEISAPLAFANATDANDQPVVIVGTDVRALRSLNSFGKTDKSFPAGSALLGAKAATHIKWQSLRVGDRPLPVAPSETITTGDADESRFFIPLADLQKVVPNAKPTIALLSIPGDSTQIESRIAELRRALPTYKVEPVRQIVATQASVLARMRSVLLLSTALIAIIAALSLLASLSASVLERRRDFAVFKALGASQSSVSGMFLLEALAIGTAGALLGYLLGCAISALIGYINFHSAVRPRLAVLPWIAAGSLLITFLGALLPLQRLQKIQPAAMLKGE
jgi:putative ABC transport system permease protein